MREYAGIGSRKTPENVLADMRRIAGKLALIGYTLRSGGAPGADQAFESGCGEAKIIFRPKMARVEWLEHAACFHPAWNRCTYYAQKLHARNSAIILGSNLNNPVEFVVCWTPDGAVTGGTGQALRIAKAYNIPIYNLFNVRLF